VIFESARGVHAVIHVALEATVGAPRYDLSHITVLDKLAAERAERLRARGPAIDQDELHGCLLCDAKRRQVVDVQKPATVRLRSVT